MNTQIIRGSEADALLQDGQFRAEWSRICRQCPWATSFQGPDFACTWYRVYRSRFEPVLVLSRDQGGTLHGLLALAVSSSDGALVVAGAQQAEYQAWICPPDLGDNFACQTVRALRLEFAGAVLTFRYLPPGTPTGWIAADEAGRSCKLAPHRRPLFQLGDGSETVKSLNKKSNKSRLNRLEKIGPLKFKRITDPKEFEGLCDDIIQSYDFRQAVVHGVAPFRDDDLKKRFHLAMMEAPGLLHVSVLKAGDQLAAAHLGVCGDKEVQLGIIAHNPHLAKHSPGKFHILFLAQMLIGEGYKQLDLTPGGDPYKERFANGFDEVHTLTIYLSSRRQIEDSIRADFAKAVKASLKSVGVEPEQFKSLASRLRRTRPARIPAALAKGARRWILRQCEMRIYSHDTKGVPDPGASRSIRCNVPGDLLRYEPAEGGQSLREFLSTSLRRLEDGLRIYTYTENDCLLCYGWLVERQEKALVSEVGQEFSLPPNSAGLFDFFEFPQARGRGLFSSLLRVMLHDAARIPGTARTFVFVSADDAPLRQAIEEVGFSYECSLFEHVRLGRTRRWVQLPGAGEVHPSFRAV